MILTNGFCRLTGGGVHPVSNRTGHSVAPVSSFLPQHSGTAAWQSVVSLRRGGENPCCCSTSAATGATALSTLFPKSTSSGHARMTSTRQSELATTGCWGRYTSTPNTVINRVLLRYTVTAGIRTRPMAKRRWRRRVLSCTSARSVLGRVTCRRSVSTRIAPVVNVIRSRSWLFFAKRGSQPGSRTAYPTWPTANSSNRPTQREHHRRTPSC